MRTYLFELAATIAALVLDGLIMNGWVYGYLPLEKALPAHASLSLAALFLFKKTGADLRFGAALSLLLFFMGPFGAAVVLFSLLLYFFLKKSASRGNLLEALLPKEEQELGDKLYERVSYGMDNFDPENLPLAFQDIMAFGNEQQKRMALERILKHFRPEFAVSLMHALNDKSSAIRVLAATAVARIDKQYWDRSLLLEQKVREQPQSSAALLKFALFSREYAKLKILDKERLQKVRQNAIAAFKAYCDQNPHSERTKEELARLLIENGEPEKAKELFYSLIDGKEEVKEEHLQGYLECLYKTGEYSAVREKTNEDLRIIGDSVRYDAILELVMLWKGGVQQHVL